MKLFEQLQEAFATYDLERVKLIQVKMCKSPKGLELFSDMVRSPLYAENIVKMINAAKEAGLSSWKPGTLGLGRAAAVVTADKVIFRRDENEIFVLMADRHSNDNPWCQDGLPMATIGGFVDPRVGFDESVYATAEREVKEEVGRIKVDIYIDYPIVSGPWKYSYIWVTGQKPFNTRILTQGIPIVTVNFIAEYISGELNESNEALNPRWISLNELNERPRQLCFDHANVLWEAVQRYKTIIAR